MGNEEFLKWLLTLGVGGVLAGFMFAFYRKDIKQYTDLWRITADQLMEVVKENTVSNVRLISLLETQERNLLRKEDIALMIRTEIKELRESREVREIRESGDRRIKE